MSEEQPNSSADARLAAEGGFDGFTALDWIRNATSVTSALIAWDQGELAVATVGRSWDVVRLPRGLGWRTIEQMRQNGQPVGPVQHTLDAVEVLVGVGTATEWELPDAEVLVDGTVAVPHPATIAPLTQRGHSWLVSPQECGSLTDAGLLYEAFAAASVGTAMGGRQ